MNELTRDTLSYEELAVKLLNKKFNDVFEIERVQAHQYLRGYYTVIAYQQDNADLLFRAYVDDDGGAISDNYVTKLVCNELSDKVAQNLNSLKGIYYIFSEAMMELTMLDDIETSLDEFLKGCPENKFSIHVNFAPEDTTAEEVALGLMHILNDLQALRGNIYLYIADQLTLAKIQEYRETHDTCYDDYEKIVESYYVGMIEFEKGTIILAATSILGAGANVSNSTITLYSSTDLGRTFNAFCNVDTAGGNDWGVWEPYLIYEEETGRLFCFYSDDSDPEHSQKLVFFITTHFKRW